MTARNYPPWKYLRDAQYLGDLANVRLTEERKTQLLHATEWGHEAGEALADPRVGTLLDRTKKIAWAHTHPRVLSR